MKNNHHKYNTISSAGLYVFMWCWSETVNVNRHTINMFQCVSARWKIHLNLTAVWNRKPGKNKRSAWRSAFFSPKRSDETKDRFLHSTSRSEWWKTKRARLSTRFRLSAWNLFSADQTRLAQIHSLQKLQFISQRCFPTGWQRASSQNLSQRSHIHTQTHTLTLHIHDFTVTWYNVSENQQKLHRESQNERMNRYRAATVLYYSRSHNQWQAYLIQRDQITSKLCVKMKWRVWKYAASHPAWNFAVVMTILCMRINRCDVCVNTLLWKTWGIF